MWKGLFAVAAAALLALPPHPFDNVFGNNKIDPNTAGKKILDSKEFSAVVEKAIAKAKKVPKGVIGPTYEQRVRTSISNQLSLDGKDDPDDEKAEPGAAKALPPHPLDGACKGANAREVIAALRKSKEFDAAVRRACKDVEPLAKDEKGATSGQAMRVKISKEFSLDHNDDDK